MIKRVRSPNYPAISLSAALDRVTALYRAHHKYAVSRELAAKAIGFGGLHGVSATAISALQKYGLVTKADDNEIKVSERALRILHPRSPEERAQAIKEAAYDPPLFAELRSQFDGTIPDEELLRNYLIHKGFAPAALASVITAYRETSEMAEGEEQAHDLAGDQPDKEPAAMPPVIPTLDPANRVSVAQQAKAESEIPERPIGRYDFEDGSYVRIVAGGEIDTEEALEMVETLIDLKRKEIARRKAPEKREAGHRPAEARSPTSSLREVIASAPASPYSGAGENDSDLHEKTEADLREPAVKIG
jgi:hypothetical protein